MQKFHSKYDQIISNSVKGLCDMNIFLCFKKRKEDKLYYLNENRKININKFHPGKVIEKLKNYFIRY